jgi:hypothetical protein
MLGNPSLRSKLIAVLRKVAMTRGPLAVRTCVFAAFKSLEVDIIACPGLAR